MIERGLVIGCNADHEHVRAMDWGLSVDAEVLVTARVMDLDPGQHFLVPTQRDEFLTLVDVDHGWLPVFHEYLVFVIDYQGCLADCSVTDQHKFDFFGVCWDDCFIRTLFGWW